MSIRRTRDQIGIDIMGSAQGLFARAHPLRWDQPGDLSREPIPYDEIGRGTVRASPSLTVGSAGGPFARAHPLRWDQPGDRSREPIPYGERRVFTHSFSYIYVIRKVYGSYYK
jgi:hypothetical protein